MTNWIDWTGLDTRLQQNINSILWATFIAWERFKLSGVPHYSLHLGILLINLIMIENPKNKIFEIFLEPNCGAVNPNYGNYSIN